MTDPLGLHVDVERAQDALLPGVDIRHYVQIAHIYRNPNPTEELLVDGGVVGFVAATQLGEVKHEVGLQL
eukprot:CAMPEP_0202969546 /NCGR_PEP_ID=MMETSP1396-20130829/15328_1 /ASSEMBLY_ACC=CAM_ASM_000872 /TAXON_ID= /ORGANISM="Pseudokeronopsis sp., Strain Brazil" /LENGTH=69 /DNA_ID=CAMNT_0049697223 /DNA_START=58 /DNA_END=263 /DNA_ORIENTATION=+